MSSAIPEFIFEVDPVERPAPTFYMQPITPQEVTEEIYQMHQIQRMNITALNCTRSSQKRWTTEIDEAVQDAYS